MLKYLKPGSLACRGSTSKTSVAETVTFSQQRFFSLVLPQMLTLSKRRDFTVCFAPDSSFGSRIKLTFILGKESIYFSQN